MNVGDVLTVSAITVLFYYDDITYVDYDYRYFNTLGSPRLTIETHNTGAVTNGRLDKLVNGSWQQVYQGIAFSETVQGIYDAGPGSYRFYRVGGSAGSYCRVLTANLHSGITRRAGYGLRVINGSNDGYLPGTLITAALVNVGRVCTY